MPRETRTTITLRWRDMDMLGHLNQSVYHELLEEARAAHMNGFEGTMENGHSFVLVRVELDYVHEVRKDHEAVTIVNRTGRVGTKSFTFEHEILIPDGTVAARGLTVMVGWDARARTSRELTEQERAALQASAP